MRSSHEPEKKEDLMEKSESQIVIDPVCLMKIDKHDAAAHTDYHGQRFYFCALSCQQAFVQDPQRYMGLAA